MTKNFPYDSNTRKNNKNLRLNNKIENTIIVTDVSLSTSQIIDAIIGKEYAATSINNKEISFLIN